jgi:SlyX protein
MKHAALMSNTAMEIQTAVDQRLMDLEIKASFTEDLVDQLNQTIFRQQEQIDALMREVRQLRLQTPDGGSGSMRSLRDELPPHY